MPLRLNTSRAFCAHLGVLSTLGAHAGAAPANGRCESEASALEKQAASDAREALDVDAHVQIAIEPLGQGISGRLIFEPEGHPRLERHVQGANCSEVIDALAFAFQMYLDGAPRKEGQDEEGRTPNSDDASQESAGAKSSGGDPDAGPEGGALSAESTPRPPPKVRLAIGPVADWSYARDMALGLFIDARMRLWKEHWLGVSLAYAQTGFFSAETDRFQTDAASIAVSWVEATRIGRSQFHLAIELGPRLSWLDVTSANDARGQYAVFSGVVSLGLSAEISPRVALEMNVGAAALLCGGPKRSEIADAPTFQSASLGGTARMGVSALF